MFEAEFVIAFETSVIVVMIMIIYRLLKTPPLVPYPLWSRKQFLEEYKERSTKGWIKVYKHLGKMRERSETGKVQDSDSNECPSGVDGKSRDKFHTLIQYKSLTLKISGAIPVDQTLFILSEWEVSLSCYPAGCSYSICSS